MTYLPRSWPLITLPDGAEWALSWVVLLHSVQIDSSEVSATPQEGKVQPHSDMRPDDPVYHQWGSRCCRESPAQVQSPVGSPLQVREPLHLSPCNVRLLAPCIPATSLSCSHDQWTSFWQSCFPTIPVHSSEVMHLVGRFGIYSVAFWLP